MTTYPLPTLGPTITPAGITIPAYQDILLSLQASYAAIYGNDINFDPSTQDGQWLAIIAAGYNDTNMACIAVYNQFSPSTSQGSGLSSVVKINGIQREAPSNSTAPLTVVGQAGSEIINGLVGDNQGFGTQWLMPGTVAIPVGGEITVTGTCTVQGATPAAMDTLVKILTPTGGWQTVTNPEAAAEGQPLELDAILRQRQTSSTNLPAQTVMTAMAGNIENLGGVSAVTYIDNDTGTTDVNGVPAHTIAFVVEGGDVQDVVNVIGLKKDPGSGTYGNTSGTYLDPFGIPHTVRFSIPTQETISVEVSITPLVNYVTSIGTEIQEAVAGYINSLGSGQDILLTRLYAPALLQGPYANPANPNDPNTYELVGVKAAIGVPGTVDIDIAFDELPICTPTNVTIVT